MNLSSCRHRPGRGRLELLLVAALLKGNAQPFEMVEHDRRPGLSCRIRWFTALVERVGDQRQKN